MTILALFFIRCD